MKDGDKRRTKTFTGCWTCRSRRVKCDEELPSCRRCRQFGIACEGYGIRLNWIHLNASAILHDADQDTSSTDHVSNERRTPRRSLVHIGTSRIPRLASPDLDETLTKIDSWSPGKCRILEQGGFTVFAANAAESTASSPATPATASSASLLRANGSPLYRRYPIPFTERVAALPLDLEQNGSSRSHQNILETVPVAETLLSLGSSLELAEIPAASRAMLHTRPQTSQNHGAPRHLDTLSLPASQKRLIHHWVTFTSRKLVLIDEPHNPCRIMMLPMALKGLLSSSEESNSNIAIFHALCASAASNLYELGGRTNDQDRVLALNHEQQAISHLRNNLAEADNHQDQSFAMAIMACITADAISGTTQRWRTHVTGGLAYLAKLHTRGLSEAVVEAFQRHMVSMAILCEIPVPDDLKSFLDDESSAAGLEFTFPYYGVSRSFLRAYDRMSSLGSAVKNPTPELERELDAFQLQQYLNFPNLPPQEPLAPNQTQGLVLHHTAKVFYYAGLVFFQRSIRHIPLDDVQSLVDLGIHELEAIERVGKGELGCMMLWPITVLGAESGDPTMHRRMRAWFKTQLKLGFRNLVVLQELIESIWVARAAPSGRGRNIDWRDIIVLPQYDVFRL